MAAKGECPLAANLKWRQIPRLGTRADLRWPAQTLESTGAEGSDFRWDRWPPTTTECLPRQQARTATDPTRAAREPRRSPQWRLLRAGTCRWPGEPRTRQEQPPLAPIQRGAWKPTAATHFRPQQRGGCPQATRRWWPSMGPALSVNGADLPAPGVASGFDPDGGVDDPVHDRVGVDSAGGRLVRAHLRMPRAEHHRAAAVFPGLEQHEERLPGGALGQRPIHRRQDCSRHALSELRRAQRPVLGNRSVSRSGRPTEWGRPPLYGNVAPNGATGGAQREYSCCPGVVSSCQINGSQGGKYPSANLASARWESGASPQPAACASAGSRSPATPAMVVGLGHRCALACRAPCRLTRTSARQQERDHAIFDHAAPPKEDLVRILLLSALRLRERGRQRLLTRWSSVRCPRCIDARGMRVFGKIRDGILIALPRRHIGFLPIEVREHPLDSGYLRFETARGYRKGIHPAHLDPDQAARLRRSVECPNSLSQGRHR